ncbi:MAG TPA: hypothetical protein PK390_02290 [Fervidobacterium nodosum]|nr:hypothetical protein [Fervidobacterium nodosum]
MLVRTAQQLHQNALSLVGTALNDTGTNSDNDVINKLNNIYGSKQFAQVYLDWYRNVNVSKLIELSLPYYLGRIKDKQEISKLAAVT